MSLPEGRDTAARSRHRGAAQRQARGRCLSAGVRTGARAVRQGISPRAWESLLSGCATYDHLDDTVTTDDQTGAARGVIPARMPSARLDGRPLRRQPSRGAAVAAGVDLGKLEPDPLLVHGAPPPAAGARAGGGASLMIYLADARRTEAGFGGALRLGGAAAGTAWGVRTLAAGGPRSRRSPPPPPATCTWRSRPSWRTSSSNSPPAAGRSGT